VKRSVNVQLRSSTRARRATAPGHSLSEKRTFDKQVADAIARGETPPQREQGQGIHGRPRAGAEVFAINAGE
jgi:hypothetical protein